MVSMTNGSDQMFVTGRESKIIRLAYGQPLMALGPYWDVTIAKMKHGSLLLNTNLMYAAISSSQLSSFRTCNAESVANPTARHACK